MKLDKSLFVSGKTPIEIQNGEEKITLYVHELGYLEAAKAYSNMCAGENNGFAELIAASVTDKDGNKFTVEEARRLKKHVAEPLLDAVLKMNTLGKTEKN